MRPVQMAQVHQLGGDQVTHCKEALRGTIRRSALLQQGCCVAWGQAAKARGCSLSLCLICLLVRLLSMGCEGLPAQQSSASVTLPACTFFMRHMTSAK